MDVDNVFKNEQPELSTEDMVNEVNALRLLVKSEGWAVMQRYLGSQLNDALNLATAPGNTNFDKGRMRQLMVIFNLPQTIIDQHEIDLKQMGDDDEHE